MLSSSGFFHNVQCPFFANGYCERPYCHFKHVESTTPRVPEYRPKQLPVQQPSLSQSRPMPNNNDTSHVDAAVLHHPPSNICGSSESQIIKSLAAVNDALTQLKQVVVGGGPLSHYEVQKLQSITEITNNSVLAAATSGLTYSDKRPKLEYNPTPKVELEKRKLTNSGTHTSNTIFEPIKIKTEVDELSMGPIIVDDHVPVTGIKIEASTKSYTEQPVKTFVRQLDLFGDDSEDEDFIDVKTDQVTIPTKGKTQADKQLEVLVEPVPDEPKPSMEIFENFDVEGSSAYALPDLSLKNQLDLMYSPDRKRRTAHTAIPHNENIFQRKLSPKEIMQQRYASVMRDKIPYLGSSGSRSTTTTMQSTGSSNKNAKSDIDDPSPSTSKDAAYIVGGPKKRLAHAPVVAVTGLKRTSTDLTIELPKVPKLDRPTLDYDPSSRIAIPVRQRYLNLIIDEFVRFSADQKETYDMAVNEELELYNGSKDKTKYLHHAVFLIKRIRDEQGLKSRLPSNNPNAKTISHDAMLGLKDNHKYSVQRGHSKDKVSYTDEELYTLMSQYLLTSDQLDEHGFPRVDPEHADRVIFMKQSIVKLLKDTLTGIHVCSRCGIEFRVNSEGGYINREECLFHWGKAWKRKVAGSIETRFTCCQSDSGTKGCSVGKMHVMDAILKSDLNGYMKTKRRGVTGHGIMALDCEMIYTTRGSELARVSLVDSAGNTVYDKIVRPVNPVVDTNSRFSGLKEADVLNGEVSIGDVKKELRRIISAETILIGHSLEGDLRCLQIRHDKVVDTSVVFPHRLGLPYKRALRNLMVENLKKIIQEDVSGHDSVEDAVSCMQLMLWKIKEDSKLRHSL